MAWEGFVPRLRRCSAVRHAAGCARISSIALQVEQPPCIQRSLPQKACCPELADGLVPASAMLCAGLLAARRQRRGRKLAFNATKSSLIAKLRERAARPA